LQFTLGQFFYLNCKSREDGREYRQDGEVDTSQTVVFAVAQVLLKLLL